MKLVCCVVGSLKDFGLPYRLVCCVIGLLKDFGLPCRLVCILSVKRSTGDGFAALGCVCSSDLVNQ